MNEPRIYKDVPADRISRIMMVLPHRKICEGWVLTIKGHVTDVEANLWQVTVIPVKAVTAAEIKTNHVDSRWLKCYPAITWEEVGELMRGEE